MSTPDQIVKKTVLKAPRTRVWEAVSDATKYGAWFGAQFDGPFKAGARLVGKIVFELADAPGGHTALTITESGFDKIPLERRAEAFRMNDGGWAMQIKLIEKYLAL